jgi:general L-amino acid transport system permease protein
MCPDRRRHHVIGGPRPAGQPSVLQPHYAGAYLAEVIRGCLRVVPRGRHNAADALKDTSLVLIIGIFNLTTAKTSIIDLAWQSLGVEVYLFVRLAYFACCFYMSRYSRHLEAQVRSR